MQNKLATPKKKETITSLEDLIEKRTSVSNTLVKEALDDFKAKIDEKKKQKIISQIESVQSNTNAAYQALKRARVAEKSAKIFLQTVSEAEQEFYKDADIEKYTTKILEASNKRVNHSRW